MRSILKAHPALKGILFDIPAIVDSVAKMFESAGLANRTTVVAGSFFDALTGAGDSTCSSESLPTRLTRRLGRAAMASNGKVLIAVPDIGSLYGRLFDVFMVALFGCGIRSVDYWKHLFTDSGFRFTRSIETDSVLLLIEAEAS